MKKILASMFVLLALSAPAAIQYSMVPVSGGGYIIKVTGGEGPLFVSEQGGGGDRFANYTVGWYDYNQTVQPTRSDVTWARATDLPAAWGTTMLYLGEFKAGDEIGLYFVRSDATNGVQDSATTGAWEDMVSRQTNVTSGNFYTDWQIYWSDMMMEGTPAAGVIQENHFMRYAVQPFLQYTMNPYYQLGDYTVPPGLDPNGGNGGSPGPVGQPLPGILASLLLGGGALGFLKLRKTKKA